ncbi:MAG: hypothetical protein ED557_12310 [Balneola sp.]|nr:MAG: hypothetical protein ED557_12310 [Balneola sp.]
MESFFIRCGFLLIPICSFLILPSKANAQSFTISGISGIEFDTSDGDFSISYTDDITVFGITVSPQSLTFSYSSADNLFELDGTVEVSFDGETIDATLDLDISDEELESIVLSVSTDFDLKSLTITPTDLGFEWLGGTTFGIFGDVEITFDDETMTVSLGDSDDPGVVIEDGTITSFSISVSADFEIKSISISPDDLTFEYDSAEDYMEMYGDVTITFDDEEMDVSLGDADDPGLIIEDGTITHINFEVTADFEVESLTIAPTGLTFEYDSGEDYFEMYGDIEFDIGDDAVVATLGDSDDPGLIIDNGSLTQINIGITEDFTFSGLSVKTDDLGVEWKSDGEFYLYGDANLSVDNETIDTDFGTSSDPGLVIKDGELHSFEVDVNSDLTLGNLEVEAKDLDIAYSDGVFEVTGELEITEVFSLSVTLGDDDNPGLEIDVSGSEPSFKVEDLTIEIENADLGTMDLKNFVLSFDENGITESEVDVVFTSGTEIDAVLKFTGDPASIDEISITYTADNLEEALELFEGIQIAEMSGTVGNLTNTSNLYVDADITTIYGGGFTLGGESATLLEMYDAVTIDKNEFTMSGDVNVGAYKDGDDWNSLLGEGDFTLDVIFQDYVDTTSSAISILYRIYKLLGYSTDGIDKYTYTTTTYSAGVLAEIDVSIPSDPMVELDASVYVNSNKDFDALVDVTFYVPSSIPFIGGDKLGSVDGAIRYKYDDLSDSYAAAWTKIKILWTKYYLGAKYKFSKQSISTFSGKSNISDIEDDIEDDESEKALSDHSPYIISSHTFEVYADPVTPNYLQFIADWDSEIDSVLVTVVGPEGIHELSRAIMVSQDDSTGQPTFDYEENMTWVTNDTGAVFIVHSASAMSEEEIGHSKLVDGRYQVLISLPRDQAPDSVSLDVTDIYQYPLIDLEVTQNENSFQLDADYWTVLPDSTHLTFYVNSIRSFELAQIITHVEASNFDEDGYGTESITISPENISESDSVYFYVMIDDGINPPERTFTTTGFSFSPNVYGTVTFPENADSLKSGLRVFLDQDQDGSFDTESTGGLEYFAITSKDGKFAIHNIEEGEYELRIVLPKGYRFTGGTDHKSHTLIEYTGDPIELDLEIEAYTEAE